MTDTELKRAKPRDKEYFLTDSNGLRVRIAPNGSKTFQFRYSFLNKRKIITIGSYPQFSLNEARKKLFEYQEMLEKGVDPQAVKEMRAKIESQNIDRQLHIIVYRWLELKKQTLNHNTINRVKRILENYLLPHFCKYNKQREIISSIEIARITHGEITAIVTKLQARLEETSRRLLMYCRNIWQFALSFGAVKNNIILNIDTKNILPPKNRKHLAKITDETILGELLRAIDSYKHSELIRSALRFVAIIPLRAENLAKLKWEYIDFENKILTIPRSNMKIKNKNLPDFSLPLPPQAIKILQEIKAFTGWGEWVFHGKVNIYKPFTYESANKALRSMGFADEARGRKQTIHSFRGTFRSLCDTYQNEHNANFEIKEAVLDHRIGNSITIAYSHKANYTEQMRPLLCWWANFLDRLRLED